MSHNVNWQTFFQRLEAGMVDQPISDNEVLSLVRNTNETIYAVDPGPTYQVSGPESRIGFMRIGFSEIG